MIRNLLIITDSGDAAPSHKIRALIYNDLFEKMGIKTTYISRRIPFIAKLLSKNKLPYYGIERILGFIDTFWGRINEIRILQSANNYDVIYLQKVGSWRLISSLIPFKRTHLVFDLNDGLWLPSWSKFTNEKIGDILSGVNAVTCDNPYGVKFAKQFNKNSFLIPDPPQVELFDRFRGTVVKKNSQIVLGWIGSPGTLFNLFRIWEPLEKLFSQMKNISLRIVGSGNDLSFLPKFERVQYTIKPYYNQIEMVEEVLNMDIGLFPLFDVEDSYARGILKATIYMSGESAVVCSPIGQCVNLIKDGINGLFAKTTEDWCHKLELLINNPDMRKCIAKAGLDTVRTSFTIEQCFSKLLKVLDPKQ